MTVLDRPMMTASSQPALPVTIETSVGTQPFSVSLADLLRQAPIYCGTETPVYTVLATLAKVGASAMVVTDADRQPIGLFTLHDLLRINVQGTSLDTLIGQVMSTRIITLPRQAPAWEAALAMTRHNIHYVLVVDDGRLLGVISGRDLFSLQRIGFAPLSTLLHEAKSLDDLVQAAADIRLLAATLVDQGVEAEKITSLISNLNDQLTLRIFQLECTGECTDINLCWMSLGSEGRYEQTLLTDQDNAILFPDPPGGDCDALRARLLPVAQRINEVLDRCGFPLCKGGVMASNPRWCLSLSEWKETFADWIHRSDAPMLLNATIFFDFRALYGNASLVTELRSWLHSYLKSYRPFLRQLTQHALANRPALGGLLHDFSLNGVGEQANTLDLKVNGSALFVDAARIFALAAGVAETNTAHRLRGAATLWHQDEAATEAWIRAFELLQGLRLRHQRAQYREGRTPDNRLDPSQLNELDRRILKESLKQAKWLQEAMKRNFQF